MIPQAKSIQSWVHQVSTNLSFNGLNGRFLLCVTRVHNFGIYERMQVICSSLPFQEDLCFPTFLRWILGTLFKKKRLYSGANVQDKYLTFDAFAVRCNRISEWFFTHWKPHFGINFCDRCISFLGLQILMTYKLFIQTSREFHWELSSGWE